MPIIVNHKKCSRALCPNQYIFEIDNCRCVHGCQYFTPTIIAWDLKKPPVKIIWRQNNGNKNGNENETSKENKS